MLSVLEGVGDTLPWELVLSEVGFSFMEQRGVLRVAHTESENDITS